MRRMGCAVWLWQAEPCCGRSCRDEPVWAGVGMRRPEAVVAGGAAWLLRAERVRIAWRALLRGGACRGREELRQGQSQPVEVPGRVPTRGNPGERSRVDKGGRAEGRISPLCANRLMCRDISRTIWTTSFIGLS